MLRKYGLRETRLSFISLREQQSLSFCMHDVRAKWLLEDIYIYIYVVFRDSKWRLATKGMQDASRARVPAPLFELVIGTELAIDLSIYIATSRRGDLERSSTA